MEIGITNDDTFDIEDPRIPVPLGPDEIRPTFQEVFDEIIGAIQASDMQDKVSAILGDDFIFIQLMDDMLFEPNSSRIRPRDFELLHFIGMSLKSVQDNVGMIRIDGHTAAIPEIDDYHVSDRILSGDRSNAVLMYFEDNVGIRGDKLTALAFGKQRPIASNDIEEGRRMNRRIEIFITEANVIAGQLDSIYEKMYQ